MTQDDLIEALKAISHPLRFRILTTLATAERSVSEIEHVTGIGQPGLSQQLCVLRKAGLVTTRKEAKQVFYSNISDRLTAVTAGLSTLIPTDAVDLSAHRAAAPGAAHFARLW